MDINKILEELYLVDSSLRKEEELIRKILSDMEAVRPNIVADPNFIISLRETILKRANEISSQPSRQFSWAMISPKYAMAGLAILVVIMIMPMLFLGGQNRFQGVSVGEIQQLNENAFGPLVYQPVVGGRGGGGGGGGLTMSAMPAGDQTKEMAPLIYPGPEYTQIKYIYEGGEFEVPSEGFVYKRKISGTSAQSIISALKNFPLSQLKNATVGDISLTEDREFGYNVSISLREGWISFFQNWERWPMQDVGCANEECFRRDFISKDQFPADSSIIAISDAFLKEYGINMSGYGQPEIIHPWKFNQIPTDPRVAMTSQLYSPDTTVIYPLLINGTKVYDEWGNLVGVNVSVNLKFNRVSSASNISINSYDQSKYSLVTDKVKIMEMAANGGISGDVMIMGWEGKTLDLKIGSPEVVLMQFYMYLNGKSELIYVPALRFPVTEIPANASFYKENVIVPLAQEIINQYLERRVSPYPAKPML